ncbi:MAG: glycosyltransferase family 39 protein [Kiloniellaceae bacterium]
MKSLARFYPLLLIAITIASLWFAWVGWLDSDDKRHVVEGIGWYEQFPYVGPLHPSLRHPIVFPLGMSFRLFGINEFSVILPNLLYYAGLLAVTYVFLARFTNRHIAFIATALITTTPIFVIQATVVFSDITEAFFVALSFWLFMEATRIERPTLWLLLGAGAAAAMGWFTRETVGALILLFGVLFLAGYKLPRARYWIMAGGFLPLVALEALFMWSMTGSPIYRYTTMLFSRENFNKKGELAGDVFNRIGNVSVNPVVDPVVVLFANHEFGLLFFFALPVALWACFSKALPANERALARILSILAVLWFLLVALGMINLHPRYFTVTAYAAAIILAIWLYRLLIGPRRLLAVAAIVVLFGANLTAIYLDNRNPLFGERSLRAYLEENPVALRTDPVTQRRTEFFLTIDGREDLVTGGLPEPGALYFYNPNRAIEIRRSDLDPRDYAPKPGWELVWQAEEDRRFTGIVLEALGLDRRLPQGLWRRLDAPNLPVAVYRIPAS